MHSIHEHCGVLFLFTHIQHTRNHPDCHKPKKLAKRGWLLLYPAAAVYCTPVCTLCTATVGLLSKSSCPAHCVWSVGLRSYDTMANCVRKQNNYRKTNTRHAAQPNPQVRRNVYRPPPYVPRSRKQLLLLCRHVVACAYEISCRTGV